MKILFLLDNAEYVEVAPEKLQIRQLSDGLAALGTEVIVPVNGEDGKPELNEDGSTKTQAGFRPFINYSVNLSVPKPVEATPVVAEAKPVDAVKLPAVKKTNGKASSAKRKAN